jgi:putative nucleotidyltransferase with HDIG domain
MDNTTLDRIEKLGAKVYFFGECVWATILKINIRLYKLAIIGGEQKEITSLLEQYGASLQKLTLQIKEGEATYEFHFLQSLDSVPLEPITINNAILSLNGKVYRAEDLQNKLIKTSPEKFLDYPEEMLKICRTASQTGFKLDIHTWLAIHQSCRLIKTTIKKNPAFIGQQLDDILLSAKPSSGLKIMWETGLMSYVLPELSKCQEISQTRRGENTNVLTHTFLALNAAECSQLLRWTMLFHDMAKPLTMEITAEGQMHFFKHEIVGAKLATAYMTKYKLPEDLIKKVKVLIENHMFDADPKLTPKGVRRLIRRVGKSNIYDLIKVREADRMGSTVPPPSDKIELLKQKVGKELINV